MQYLGLAGIGHFLHGDRLACASDHGFAFPGDTDIAQPFGFTAHRDQITLTPEREEIDRPASPLLRVPPAHAQHTRPPQMLIVILAVLFALPRDEAT